MAIWNFIKDKAAMQRLKDEAIHAAAMEEVKSGHRRDGLWTKAIIESNGDESRAKIAYLRHLVAAIRDDIYLAQRAEEVFSASQSSSTKSPPRSASPKSNQQPATPAVGHGPPRGASQDELMRYYGITRDGEKYVFGTYRFGELKNALAHARHVESLKQRA